MDKRRGGLWTTVAGGNGEGSTNNKLSSTRFYVDAAGNIFVDYGNSNPKWSPGATGVCRWKWYRFKCQSIILSI
jgi:hypothetical protein